MSTPTLGRGLSSLLGEEDADRAALERVRTARTVPIEHLHPGTFQPRHTFDEEALEDLVSSVRERGLLQPIVVRRHAEHTDQYEIVAGERRWRAAQRAGLHEVPVMLRELSDQDALEIALIENVQRRNLSPVEEAMGYDRLMQEFSYSQEKLAQAVGKSRPHVANLLRLLGLSDEIKAMVDDGSLSAGHARTLIGVENAADLAREAVAKGWSVREIEARTRARKDPEGKTRPKASKPSESGEKAKDADTRALEEELTAFLGLRVSVSFGADRARGSLTVHYETLDQLDDLLTRLRRREQKSAVDVSDMPADPDAAFVEIADE